MKMKICWFSLILLLSFLKSVPINGDTYHYQVIRKICPSGTYHDPLKDKCRKLPGGGEMIKINLDARCSGGFLGLLAHSKKSKYYYVCRKDGVLTCMCKPKEHFSRIRLKCENKCRKDEHLTHAVVDHIMDKYKCSIMNGIYEDKYCLLPVATTTIDPQITSKSIEDYDHDKITRLERILNYLTFMRNLNNQFKSFEESIEISSLIPPPNPFDNSGVTLRSINIPEFTTEIVAPRNFESIETSTVTLPINVVSPGISGRSFDESHSRTTISDLLENTTIVTTTDFPESTLETEQTTESIDALLNSEDTTIPITIQPRSIKSRQKVITTEGPEPEVEVYYEYYYEDDPHNIIHKSNVTKKKVSAREFDDDYEDHFIKIVTIHEVVDGKVESTTLSDYSNETSTVNADVDETTQQQIAEALRRASNDTFDYQVDDVTQSTMINLESTTASEIYQTSTTEGIDISTYMAPVPLIQKYPGDMNFNDVDQVASKIFDSNEDFYDETTSTTTEALLEKTTINFGDNIDTSTTELFTTSNIPSTTELFTTSNIPSTTENDDVSETTIETRMYKFVNFPTTTKKSETTLGFEASTDEKTTITDQSITETINETLFDESTTKKLDETSTTFPTEINTSSEESTTEFLTSTQRDTTTLEPETSTLEIQKENKYLNFKFDESTLMAETITTESPISTTDFITSTTYSGTTTPEIPDSNEDSTTLIATTTDSSTFKTESTSLLDSTTILKRGDISEDDSEEDLKNILSTTLKIPRLMKILESTDDPILGNIEITSKSNIPKDDNKMIVVTDKIKVEIGPDINVSVKPSLISIDKEVKKKINEDVEYYYEYEEYAVDDDGIEVMSDTIEKKLDKITSKDGVSKVLKKHRRDKSEEYYAESISASRENRKNTKDEYNYFY